MQPIDPRRIRRRWPWAWLLPVPVGMVFGVALLPAFWWGLRDPTGVNPRAAVGGLLGLAIGLWLRFRGSGRPSDTTPPRSDPDAPPSS